MAKKIKSYKDVPIRWRENRQRFVADLGAIGGGELTFKTLPEARAAAKKAFVEWMDGPPIAVESVESDWSVDLAVQKYLEMAERRCDDEEDHFGPASLDAQTTHLNVICDLTVEGFRLGKRYVKHLTLEIMVDRVWPKLKRDEARSRR